LDTGSYQEINCSVGDFEEDPIEPEYQPLRRNLQRGISKSICINPQPLRDEAIEQTAENSVIISPMPEGEHISKFLNPMLIEQRNYNNKDMINF
jgi:hypothetical protein